MLLSIPFASRGVAVPGHRLRPGRVRV